MRGAANSTTARREEERYEGVLQRGERGTTPAPARTCPCRSTLHRQRPPPGRAFWLSYVHGARHFETADYVAQPKKGVAAGHPVTGQPHVSLVFIGGAHAGGHTGLKSLS